MVSQILWCGPHPVHFVSMTYGPHPVPLLALLGRCCRQGHTAAFTPRRQGHAAVRVVEGERGAACAPEVESAMSSPSPRHPRSCAPLAPLDADRHVPVRAPHSRSRSSSTADVEPTD
jgi:hypothetical protein